MAYDIGGQPPTCPACGPHKAVKLYNEEYDSYYCRTCDVWLESKCTHDDCLYCPKRPDKPSQA